MALFETPDKPVFDKLIQSLTAYALGQDFLRRPCAAGYGFKPFFCLLVGHISVMGDVIVPVVLGHIRFQVIGPHNFRIFCKVYGEGIIAVWNSAGIRDRPISNGQILIDPLPSSHGVSAWQSLF